LESPVRINLCQLLDVSEISTKEFPEDWFLFRSCVVLVPLVGAS
jgi:hypothetical protein